MQLKSQQEIDAILKDKTPGIDDDRRNILVLTARNTNPSRYQELLDTFDNADGKGAKAEAKFIRSLFNIDAASAEPAGAAAPGNTPATTATK